jgi:uncharacterized protein YegP (UPF0339 family)
VAPARFQLFRVTAGEISWRFVASNNRELARSVDVADDEDESRDTVQQLQSELAVCRATIYPDGSGRWRWDIRIDGLAVAVSSRPYFRRVECDTTMRQFLRQAVGAPVSPGVAFFRHLSSDHGERTIVDVPPRVLVPAQKAAPPGRNGRMWDVPHGSDIRRSPERSRRVH